MKKLLALALLLGGCATTNTYWGEPELTPFVDANPRDTYECVQSSRQQLGMFELRQSVKRDAQNLYVLCMKSRGYREAR
jgi:hypothetical protein